MIVTAVLSLAHILRTCSGSNYDRDLYLLLNFLTCYIYFQINKNIEYKKLWAYRTPKPTNNHTCVKSLEGIILTHPK